MNAAITPRERDSIVVALNYWIVNRADGDWGAYLSEAHMLADGLRPLTRAMVDKLIARLEKLT